MFVSDIIEDVVEVLGRCDKPKALKRISDAVQALQDEGDWNANVGVLDIRTFADGTRVTLPREVETPLAVAVDGVPAFMRDEFFRFHLNGDGLVESNTVPWAWDDHGPVGSFMDFVTPGPVIVHGELKSDTGKLLRILGKGPDGRPLRSQQEDGSWLDGVLLPVEFSLSAPVTAPTTRIFKRIASPTPMSLFVSAAAHQLVTGTYMQVSLVSGGFPAPLVNGARYYIRVVDSLQVTLHTTRLDARTGQSPVEVTEVAAGTVLAFLDTRSVSARTQFQTSTPSLLADFDLVTFLGTALPSPLSTSTPYVARVDGADKFAVYANTDDAVAEANPINVTSPGTAVKVRALKTVSPVTTLTFTVPHNFLTADQVIVQNSGGEVPSPLLAGTPYFVFVINAYTVTLHPTAAEALSNQNPITLVSLGSGVNSLVKVIPATVSLGSASNVTTTLPHNLNMPGGTGGAVTVALTAQSVVSATVSAPGIGYAAPPILTVTGGGGTGATLQATVAGGVITAVQVITGGIGYTSVPTVTVTPASGSFVQFTTDGTLPNPITQGTVYRAEAPMTATTFTLNSTVPAPIAISSLGAGQLFVMISRAFSVGFLPRWRTDAVNYATGQAIRYFSQGTLPITSPQINQSTLYYLRVLDANYVEVYTSEAEAELLTATTGRISALALGNGQLYLSSEKDVTAIVRDNYLDVEFSGYLENLATVQFETTGTLPAPLVPATDYEVSVVDGKLELYDGGSLVMLSDVGDGLHTMRLSRELSVVPSTTLVVPGQQYTDGDAVTVTTDGTLPSPLTALTTYYLRTAGLDAVSVYDTLAHALDLAHTVGLVTFLSAGSGVSRLEQVLPATVVATVDQMEKPETDGFLRVYGWDTSQDTNLVLLGDLHPTEFNPSYRRIQIANSVKWLRMKYRRRSIAVTSERDFINLDSKMAIVMMVQSQDLLLKRFADEAERYRKSAVDYLNKRNRALDGPRTVPMQIDADVTTRPDDYM